MKTLIAVIYKHRPEAAAEVLAQLQDLQREYLIDLEDAVIVRRNDKGRLYLQQSINLTATSAWSGAVWGLLIGMIFAGPIGGAVAGAAGAGIGALTGSLDDYGIEDGFVEELSTEVESCCSALFVLARSMTTDKVIEELQGTGGRILRTSLPADVEHRLQAALDAARPTT